MYLTNNKTMSTQNIFELTIPESYRKSRFVFESPFACKLVGNNQTCSQDVFINRLKEDMGIVYNIIENMKWKNICLCGDYVSKLLEHKYEYNVNDIVEISVYGNDKKTVKKNIVNLCSQLLENLNQVIFFTFKYLPDNIYAVSQDIRKPLFISGWKIKNIDEIIRNFSFTHNQVVFNGEKIITTDGFIDSKITRETIYQNINHYISAIEFITIYNNGYNLLKNSCDIIVHGIYSSNSSNYKNNLGKKIFHNYIQNDNDDEYDDTYTGKLYDLNFDELLSDDNVKYRMNFEKYYSLPKKSLHSKMMIALYEGVEGNLYDHPEYDIYHLRNIEEIKNNCDNCTYDL